MGSECWDHFEKKAGQKAECKHCKELLCYRNGTTRLNRHYKETCPVRHPKPGRSGQQGSQDASAQAGIHNLQNASTFSKASSDNSGQRTTAAAAAEDQLIRMIALHGFPSSMVEDVQFIRFVQMLCPDFKMPSQDDVRKRCDELFDQEMRSLKDALARTPGLVSLSLGMTDIDYGEIAYLAAHFIDEEWNFHCRVIEVFKVVEGEDKTCEIFKNFLRQECCWDEENYYFQVEDTISCWGLLPKFSGVLIDNFGTTMFGQKVYNADDMPHLCTTQRELLCATDLRWDLPMIAETLLTLSDFEDCVHAFEDENLKKKRREISSLLQLDHPWAYRWWYLHYYALEIIHEVCSSRPAQIGALAGKIIFHETWITELFRTTLGTIYHATRTISVSRLPTSNLVLIEMFKVRGTLVSGYNDGSGRKQITGSNNERVVEHLQNAIRKLDSFLLKSYLLLSIPLILDPRYKLVYVESILKTVFESIQMNGPLPADIVSRVRKEFLDLFEEYSKQGTGTECINQSNYTEHTNHVHEMDVDPSEQRDDSTFQLIEQGNTSSQENTRELDAYLQDETVPLDQDDFDCNAPGFHKPGVSH